MISVYNLHHSPAVWDNPEAFEPERFDLDGPVPNEQVRAPDRVCVCARALSLLLHCPIVSTMVLHAALLPINMPLHETGDYRFWRYKYDRDIAICYGDLLMRIYVV